MMGPSRSGKNDKKTQGKGSNSSHTQKQTNQAVESDDDEVMLDEILSSINDQSQSPKMKSLANELATLLLPAITSVLTNVIEKSSVQKDQFERAKANIRVIKYDNG
jgi:hypothetical protein